MTAPAPRRLLIVRPDTYGDLVLFEPALRRLRAHWPDTAITLLVRAAYLDISSLFPAGIGWMPTTTDSYREGMGSRPDALAELRARVEAFDPDCVVAACYEKTWLEAIVASWAPAARRVSMGPPEPDPITGILLARETGREAGAWFPEVVEADASSHECEKNRLLTAHLLGTAVEIERPQLEVPGALRQAAQRWLDGQGVAAETFLVCCPAGSANVTLKSWGAERFAGVLATASAEMRLPAVIAGHESEAAVLNEVAALVEARTGQRPPVWAGWNGGFAETAALVGCARAYVGNDTGLAHVASALDRPALVVYGGGTWPRFTPAGGRTVAVVQPLECFGCGWRCLFEEPLCLTKLPETAVLEGLRTLLDEPSDGREILREPPAPDVRAQVQAAVDAAEAARPASRRPRFAVEVGRQDLTRLLDQLALLEHDRAERLRVIEEQGREIDRLRQGVANDGGRVAALEAQLHASEADRQARLEIIEQQGHALGRLPVLEATLAASEADRAARLEVIERQGQELGRIPALEADVAFLREQVTRLEAARLEGLAVIERQQRELGNTHTHESELESSLTRSRSDAAAMRVRIDVARRSPLYRLLRRLGVIDLEEPKIGAQGDGS